MWTYAEYQAVSLFSLRLGEATATGAKTLLVPTPFAIRTALLDVAVRIYGVRTAPDAFKRIRGLSLAIHPPERVAVTNLFAKVRKPRRNDAGEEEDDQDDTREAMQPTISFREYAHLHGDIALAFSGPEEVLAWVEPLLPHVAYLGKRGSFFQLLTVPERAETLPPGFVTVGDGEVWGTKVSGSSPGSFPLGVLQLMDDWGPGLTWEKVNVYTQARIVLGSDRIRKGAILPYRLSSSSRSFSYYERIL